MRSLVAIIALCILGLACAEEQLEQTEQVQQLSQVEQGAV
jgi:hypothetical protein